MNEHRLRDINGILLILATLLGILLLHQIFKPFDGSLPESNHPPADLAAFPTLEIKRGEDWEGLSYDSIVEMNLFSSERKPPTGQSPSVDQAEGESVVSYEGYELIGTVLSDQERSFALIRKGGARGETKPYRMRDPVDGMELREIRYDRIILSRNGREVTLFLEPREEERKAFVPPSSSKIERPPAAPGTPRGSQPQWTPQQRKGQ